MPQTVVVETKSQWQSKTFWINVIAGAIAIGDILMGMIGPGGFLLEQWGVYILAGMGALNVILRRLTSQPIEGTKAAEG
jgi:hypothetical protein